MSNTPKLSCDRNPKLIQIYKEKFQNSPIDAQAFVKQHYLNYLTRVEASVNNKELSKLFIRQFGSTNSSLSSEARRIESIKVGHTNFNDAFFGVKLLNIFNNNGYNKSTLAKKSPEEFNNVLKNIKELHTKAAVIYHCGISSEKLIDRFPLPLKIAYTNLQNEYLQIYRNSTDNALNSVEFNSTAKEMRTIFKDEYKREYTDFNMLELNENFKKPGKKTSELYINMLKNEKLHIEKLLTNNPLDTLNTVDYILNNLSPTKKIKSQFLQAVSTPKIIITEVQAPTMTLLEKYFSNGIDDTDGFTDYCIPDDMHEESDSLSNDIINNFIDGTKKQTQSVLDLETKRNNILNYIDSMIKNVELNIKNISNSKADASTKNISANFDAGI